MKKFRKQMIMLQAREDKKMEVLASVSGPWAIHQKLTEHGLSEVQLTLTHVPTGLAVADARRRKALVALAELLEQAGTGWDTPNPKMAEGRYRTLLWDWRAEYRSCV